MANHLMLIFKKEDMQRLMDQNPDKILVRTTIEDAILNDGKKAGVVNVYADAMKRGNPSPLITITGCPIPPCTSDDE